MFLGCFWMFLGCFWYDLNDFEMISAGFGWFEFLPSYSFYVTASGTMEMTPGFTVILTSKSPKVLAIAESSSFGRIFWEMTQISQKKTTKYGWNRCSVFRI